MTVDIYVDVLIILNAVIDFLILDVTAKITRAEPKTARLVLASFVSALFSLTIFLENYGIAFQTVIRLACSFSAVSVCFGIKSAKQLIRQTVSFYIASFLFFGLMLSVWFIIKPQNMSVNNGVVYLNFSPSVLLIFTAVSYILICIFRKVINVESKFAKRKEVSVFLDNKKTTFTAILDTGNSLLDTVSGKGVLVADKKIMKKILGENYEPFFNALPNKYSSRFRLIPIKTVSGNSMLTAVRIDYLKIDKNLIADVTVAESESEFSDDYSAVINPEILEVL